VSEATTRKRAFEALRSANPLIASDRLESYVDALIGAGLTVPVPPEPGLLVFVKAPSGAVYTRVEQGDAEDLKRWFRVTQSPGSYLWVTWENLVDVGAEVLA
jgi:hypothetical protein